MSWASRCRPGAAPPACSGEAREVIRLHRRALRLDSPKAVSTSCFSDWAAQGGALKGKKKEYTPFAAWAWAPPPYGACQAATAIRASPITLRHLHTQTHLSRPSRALPPHSKWMPSRVKDTPFCEQGGSPPGGSLRADSSAVVSASAFQRFSADVYSTVEGTSPTGSRKDEDGCSVLDSLRRWPTVQIGFAV